MKREQIVMAGFLFFALSMAAPALDRSDISLYLSFEKGLEPDIASGATTITCYTNINVKAVSISPTNVLFDAAGAQGRAVSMTDRNWQLSFNNANIFPPKEGTISFWTKTLGPVPGGNFLYIYGANVNIQLYWTTDGRLRAYYGNTATTVASAWYTWLNDTWTHVAFTFNPIEQALYANGELRVKKSTGLQDITFGTNQTICIRYATESVDEVICFKRALTAEEVRSLARAPLGTARLGVPPMNNPTIDGDITSETEWDGAVSLSSWVDPQIGSVNRDAVNVSVGYSATALNALFTWPVPQKYRDNPAAYLNSPLQKSVTAQDGDIAKDDYFGLRLSAPGNTNEVYFFGINGAGAKRDEKNGDAAWNGTWSASQKCDNNFWMAEISIPFATLGGTAADEWGVNFMHGGRRIDLLESVWAYQPRTRRPMAVLQCLPARHVFDVSGFGDLGAGTLAVSGAVANAESEAFNAASEVSITDASTDAVVLYGPQVSGGTIAPGGMADFTANHGLAAPVCGNVLLNLGDQAGGDPLLAYALPFTFARDLSLKTYYYPTPARLEAVMRLGAYAMIPKIVGTTVSIIPAGGGATLLSQSVGMFTNMQQVFVFDCGPLPVGAYDVVAVTVFTDRPAVTRTERFSKDPVPAWLGNQVGILTNVPQPWTPMTYSVADKKISCWGRDYTLGAAGLPAQVNILGQDVLAGPARLLVGVGGVTNTLNLQDLTATTAATGIRVSYQANGSVGNVGVAASGWVEFDGFMSNAITVSAPTSTIVSSLAIEIPIKPEFAKLFDPGVYYPPTNLGKSPQVTTTVGGIARLGDEERGLQFSQLNSVKCILNPNGTEYVARFEYLSAPVKMTNALTLTFGLQALPARPRSPIYRSCAMDDCTFTTDLANRLFIATPIYAQSWCSHKNYLNFWNDQAYDPATIEAIRADNIQDWERRNKTTRVLYLHMKVFDANTPEYRQYRYEWLGRDAPPAVPYDPATKTDMAAIETTYAMCAVPSYQDFYMWYLDKTIRYLTDNGRFPIHIYLDGGSPDRNYIQRLCATMKSVNPLNQVLIHMSGMNGVYGWSFIDWRIEGEECTQNYSNQMAANPTLPHDYTRILNLDKVAARYSPFAYGDKFFLNQTWKIFSGMLTDKSVEAHLWGLHFVHDGAVWAGGGPENLRALTDLGWDSQVEYVPYWRTNNGMQVVSPVSPVVASGWKRGANLLVMVLNDSDTNAPCTLRVDLTKNGFPSFPVKCTDYGNGGLAYADSFLTKTPMALGTVTNNGPISFEIGRHSYKFLMFGVTNPLATVTLGNLSQVYNGSPRPATATTVPAGLNVTLTYNGAATAPWAVGSYAVVGTVNDPNYWGSAQGTLTIAKGNQTIAAFTPANGSSFVVTNQVGLRATASSGLAVNFAVVSGPGTIAGSTNLTFSGAGAVKVAARQDGNANYYAAPSIVNTYNVNKASAQVTLNYSNGVYNGSPHPATATTVPAGLPVGITYNGSTTAPKNAGAYAVVGTVNDAVWQGSASGTLTIAKQSRTVAFNPVTPQAYNTVTNISSRATASAGDGAWTFGVRSGHGLLVNGTNLWMSYDDVTVRAAIPETANYLAAFADAVVRVSALPPIRYVATNGLAKAPYTNWTEAATSIQAAIDVSAAGDMVLVGDGVYILTNQVSVTKAITLQSANGRDVTRVHANNYAGKPVTNRCLYMTAGTVKGFTFSGGIAAATDLNGRGGGVHAVGGTLTDAVISNNLAYALGGGLWGNCGVFSNIVVCDNTLTSGAGYSGGGGAAFRMSTVKNSRFIRNKATFTSQDYTGGGGIRIYEGACSFENCDISQNTVNGWAAGGGIAGHWNTTPVFINCTINSNVCGGYGGGYGSQHASASSVFSNCVFIGNRAAFAGGFYGYVETLSQCVVSRNATTGDQRGGGGVFDAGTMRIRNCLISENESVGDTSTYGGGGLCLKGGVAESCTIARNKANNGGGLRLIGGGVTNCIVYHNTAAGGNDVKGVVANCAYSCASDLIAGQNNNIAGDPVFMANGSGAGTNAVAGNYRLGLGSPCVNTGKNLDWMTNGVDLDGLARVRLGTVDRGAYESTAGVVHYVATNGLARAPYTSWADAATDIQAALDVAAAGEAVLVGGGVYNLNNQLSVTKAITLQSANGRDVTRVHANNYAGKPVTNRCLYMTAGTVKGFTFSGGIATLNDLSGFGGGVYAVSGTLTDTVISNNLAYRYGGGLWGNCGVFSNIVVCDNTLTSGSGYSGGGGAAFRFSVVKNSRFIRNKATFTSSDYTGGGGIRIYEGACSFENCDISQNTVNGWAAGGGVAGHWNTTPVFINCTINSNYCGGYGGGYGSQHASASSVFSNCVFIGNRAALAGGLYGCYETMSQCIVSRNATTGDPRGGGGVFDAGAMRIRNCLISENEAVGDTPAYGGGGLCLNGGVAESCTLARNKANNGGGLRLIGGGVTNCIVYNNTAVSGSDVKGVVANCAYSCASDLAAGQNNNIVINPGFMVDGSGAGTNAVAGNYRLGPGSPCANTGRNTDWMTNGVDLDGFTRIHLDTVDRGAYESASESGQVGWWKLDETSGDTALDSSRSGNAGTLRNAPEWTGAGHDGGALSFNGSNSYVSVKDVPALKYKGGELTLSAWVYLNPTATNRSAYLISKPWNENGEYNYRLYVSLADNSVVFLLKGDTQAYVKTPAGLMTRSGWHYVAATANAAKEMKIYVDGALAASGVHSIANWTPPKGDQSRPLTIGSPYTYADAFAWPGTTLDGMLDDVRVHTGEVAL